MKHSPEDFIVEEIIDLEKKPGDYLYVKLIKKNLNTLDVLNQIAKILNIPRSSIGFAGNKDKNALTTQYISLYKVNKEDIKKIKIEGLTLIPLHSACRPIALGSLEGNNFKIKFDKKVRRLKFRDMVNYFGEQRFSSNNKDVGKALLLKQFEKACRLINNDTVNNYLKKNPGDYIGALKEIDKKLLSLYINAFQAYLWNEVVKLLIRENYRKYRRYEDLIFVDRPKSNIIIPLISYDTILRNSSLKRYYLALLNKEGVKLSDYYIKEFPNIVFKTSSRPMFIQIKYLKFHNGFVEFFLPKGSFATILMKNLDAILSSKQ